MNKAQRMVQQFHETFVDGSFPTPRLLGPAEQRLRLNLIYEEASELDAAFVRADMVEIADALADLLYVVYGTAVQCGIDMAPIFAEVHRSNMSKAGGHRRVDGKWEKPATYSPAALAPLLKAQGWTEEAQP